MGASQPKIKLGQCVELAGPLTAGRADLAPSREGR